MREYAAAAARDAALEKGMRWLQAPAPHTTTNLVPTTSPPTHPLTQPPTHHRQDYTEFHFNEEERMMEHIGFPDIGTPPTRPPRTTARPRGRPRLSA